MQNLKEERFKVQSLLDPNQGVPINCRFKKKQKTKKQQNEMKCVVTEQNGLKQKKWAKTK